MWQAASIILICIAAVSGGIGLLILGGTSVVVDATIRQMVATKQLSEDHLDMVKPVHGADGPEYDDERLYSSKLYAIDNPSLQATLRVSQKVVIIALAICGVSIAGLLAIHAAKP